MAKKIIILFLTVVLISSCWVENRWNTNQPLSNNIQNNVDTVESWTTETKEVVENNEPKENIEIIVEENWDVFTNENNNEISEEEFNNSWRAKAIESETDLWNFFQNEEIWFSLNYPLNEILLSKDEYKTNEDDFYFKIDIKEIWENNDEPMRLSNTEEMETIAELSAWNFWKNPDFTFENSKKVTSIGNIFAQDYLVLSRFDVCDITLERAVVFYFNNKEIKLTSFASINKLKESMPEYFTIDESNCGTISMWNNEKQNDFYNSLIEWTAPDEIQTWFNDFDKMSESIIFDNK